MSVFVLKLIALLTMVIDHTAAVFSEAVAAPLLPEAAVILLRSIGRVAFPLYAFLLAEGFRHTRSRPKYALRLLGLGLLSQIPYAFTLNGWVAFSEMPWWRRVTDLNILFSLALGVLLLAFLDAKGFDRRFASWGAAAALAAGSLLFYLSALYELAFALGLAAALALAARVFPKLGWAAGQAARFILFSFVLFRLLRCNISVPVLGRIHFSFDYGIDGLILFAALHWAKTPRRSGLVIALWGLWCYWEDLAAAPIIAVPAVLFIAVAAVCASFYNGRRGRDDRRLFYWAYPGHLLLLWGALALAA